MASQLLRSSSWAPVTDHCGGLGFCSVLSQISSGEERHCPPHLDRTLLRQSLTSPQRVVLVNHSEY